MNRFQNLCNRFPIARKKSFNLFKEMESNVEKDGLLLSIQVLIKANGA